MRWIKDEEFIRDQIPMTKFNIRILTIAYLEIKKGDRLLDIGAGTGSISIEASLQGASTWAIEKEDLGISLIEKNNEKFKANVNIIRGVATRDLPDIKINKCFIGGSRGELEDIFKYLEKNLEKNGILVANFIMLKNLHEFQKLLEKYNYKNIEVQMVQSSFIDKIGLLKGQNPIFIIKGEK